MSIIPISTLPNIIFVILIALATGYLTFLTAKGSLTNNRFSKFWEKPTKRGRLVLFLLFIILLLLICQEWNSQVKGDRKEEEVKKERVQRDSLITEGIRSGVDSNRKKLFDDISKAFRKQGLKLDTVKESVERIRDSAKNITNNYNQIDPVLVIDSDGISQRNKTDTLISYQIKYTSHDAGSTNFNITIFMLTQNSDGTREYIMKFKAIPSKTRLPNEGAWISGFTIDNPKDHNIIFAYLKGKYTTLDGTKTYNIDDLYLYNVKTGLLSQFDGTYKEKVIKLIPRSELIY